MSFVFPALDDVVHCRKQVEYEDEDERSQYEVRVNDDSLQEAFHACIDSFVSLVQQLHIYESTYADGAVEREYAVNIWVPLPIRHYTA